MRANSDSVLLRREKRFAHHRRISRVQTAGDVGRADEREQLLVVARAFAEIGVEIDAQLHPVCKAKSDAKDLEIALPSQKKLLRFA